MGEDGDELAIRELQRRQSRLTSILGAGCILVGVPVTALLCIALVELQFHYFGVAELGMTMTVAVIVGVGGCIRAAISLRRALLRARAPSWILELAANHRERREQLEQIASLWH